jgi:hypothetical protein
MSIAHMLRFIVLIPHRDCYQKIEAFKRKLFGTGFLGAYSFPVAAPLALVSRSLTKAELKPIATTLRNLSVAQKGKMTAEAFCPVTFPELAFWGMSLDLPALPAAVFPETSVVQQCLAPALVLAVRCLAPEQVADIQKCLAPEQAADIQQCLAPVSFRAAAVANLVIRPRSDDGYSFEWKIGVPAWLPAYKPT